MLAGSSARRAGDQPAEIDVRVVLRVAMCGVTVAVSACTGFGGNPVPVSQPSSTQQPVSGQWTVDSREHVDLWLHAFALLQADSTRVPFFRRGYRDSVVTDRKRANVTSMIDANRDKLASRFLAFPNLVSAQFIPLYFGTWDETRQSAELFLRTQGDVNQAGDLRSQQIIQLFAGYFPTQPDREWLRLFIQAVDDERLKFFSGYWRAQQQRRVGVRASVDSMWRNGYRQKFARFLTNSGADRGTMLLSLPLDGEGRTLDAGQRNRLVAVNYPATPAEATEALYTFVHEIVSSVTSIAIEDNTSPAEKRSGQGDRYASAALVRGGAMLMQRVAPELADGYARYYLRAARVPFTSGDAVTALATAFPLPDTIRDAIKRQIEVVLGGI
jgi:hypothetical protein